MTITQCRMKTETILLEWKRMSYLFDEVRKYGQTAPKTEEDKDRMCIFVDMVDEELERIHGMIDKLDTALDIESMKELNAASTTE